MKPKERFTVALISIDGATFKEAKQIKRNIQTYYNCDVYELLPITIPMELMKNGRDTVLSSSLLKYFRKTYKESEFDKIVAITEKPLYFTEQFPSIRGLGTQNGKTAVISTFKIKNEASDDKKFYKSLLLKVTRHEIGHTLGLVHCKRNSKCLMTSGVNPEEFYSLQSTFCDSCKIQLQRYLKRINRH
ncbi:hypothetical protein [Ekhidna sp.]|uniref:hypothetical protein n=1 Tax=Ekhidna sp. TaxID=2608089 RepID=UPI0032EBEEF7